MSYMIGTIRTTDHGEEFWDGAKWAPCKLVSGGESCKKLQSERDKMAKALEECVYALETINTGLEGLKRILPTMTIENKAIFETVLIGGGEIVKQAIKQAKDEV